VGGLGGRCASVPVWGVAKSRPRHTTPVRGRRPAALRRRPPVPRFSPAATPSPLSPRRGGSGRFRESPLPTVGPGRGSGRAGPSSHAPCLQKPDPVNGTRVYDEPRARGRPVHPVRGRGRSGSPPLGFPSLMRWLPNASEQLVLMHDVHQIRPPSRPTPVGEAPISVEGVRRLFHVGLASAGRGGLRPSPRGGDADLRRGSEASLPRGAGPGRGRPAPCVSAGAPSISVEGVRRRVVAGSRCGRTCSQIPPVAGGGPGLLGARLGT
jgi:hypothetical protein